MLTHPTHEALRALKLDGMAEVFAELLAREGSRQMDPVEWIGLMLDRESASRDSRRFETRLRAAKLRESGACMEDVDYRAARQLDRALFRSLQDGAWITRHRSILITGPCGVGKSWLACALGHEACRQGKVIARVEAGPRGCDTRFIVTSLTKGTGKTLYEGVYCARGQAENHIKAFKTHLAADRTSCTSATANQLRLFLHAGAYWLMWTLRAALPKRSPWRRAQFDTLRLRVVKIAARVVEMKTRITLHLPSACPAAPLMRLLLARLPRMAPV